MKNWKRIKSKKGLVIWKDMKTGLLWSPPLPGGYTFDQATTLAPELFNKNFGKFKDRVWAVPARDEIAVAILNGMLEAIPEMESFWSASVFSYDRNYAWIFSGYGGGGVYAFNRNGTYAVRCCGRLEDE